MTKRAEPLFRVLEFDNGQPWIVLELCRGDKLDLLKKTVGFDLPPRTTLDEAKQITDYLQRHLTHVSET